MSMVVKLISRNGCIAAAFVMIYVISDKYIYKTKNLVQSFGMTQEPLHSGHHPKGLRSLDRKLSERPGHCGHQLWKQLVTLAVLGHYEHTVPWSIMFFGWIFVVFAFCCVCGFFG